jgi:3',5'-cyclic AMP phosphodiesterase CpdA
VLARGNHDQGAAGCLFAPTTDKRWRALCKRLGAEDPVRVFGDVRIVALDSCCRTVSPLDFAQGKLGARQLAILRDAIINARFFRQRIVVALHHDPISSNPVEKLQDANAFLRLAYGVVDVVVFGHTHGHGFTWRCPRGVPTILHRCADMVDTFNDPVRFDMSDPGALP